MIQFSNILDVFNRATDSEREEGASWYSAARTFAIGLSERYGIALDAACGVIAALSPQLSWSMNMRYADQICATGDAPVLGLSKSKALRILSGESVESVLACPVCKRSTRKHVCSGEKVRNFYRCIADPSCDAVCIDRHAFDIASGEVTDDKSRKALDKVGVYQSVADAYRAAAVVLGISAATVQAITWVA